MVIRFLPINAVFPRQIAFLLVITPLKLLRLVVVFALPRFAFSNVLLLVMFFLLSSSLPLLRPAVDFVLVVACADTAA